MTRRPIAFGLNVDPAADGLDLAERIARLADAAGIEYVGIQDHPYNAGFVDTLTLVTHLAARTRSVRFFPNVANLPLRPPAMLAKQAATIDRLSGGRFELGLGAGAFGRAIAGMGGPERTRAQGREALSEAIDIIRASWAGRPFRFEGTYYQTPLVQPGPAPAHDIGIWLGVVGPKAAALLGQKADGWSVSTAYVPPPRARELGDVITSAARDAGRDPEKIVRLYNVGGLIVDADDGAFAGPVARWVDTLVTLYAEFGLDTFVFWPTTDREHQAELFAREVVPAVRAALAASVG